MQSNLRPQLRKAGIIIFAVLAFCRLSAQPLNPYPSVDAIPTPAGYHRITAKAPSFATWLRNIPLKKDRAVYLYDGRLKHNQDAQFAVLDISVGHQDLQQCADAVMRLRAEYCYAAGNYSTINFFTEQGVALNFRSWLTSHPTPSRRTTFYQYLNSVFTWCSTRTLARQLLPITNFHTISAGDVLIRSGSPGHAMLVVDMAEDVRGHRIYLLAQSYMPAQDIHIVKNPMDAALSPWYRADASKTTIETPEWIFKTNELRTWP